MVWWWSWVVTSLSAAYLVHCYLSMEFRSALLSLRPKYIHSTDAKYVCTSRNREGWTICCVAAQSLTLGFMLSSADFRPPTQRCSANQRIHQVVCPCGGACDK
ncbi:hypothetical protein BD779DRAFT_106912 [Infundibulicybe gibba]|nr:hypothetical protein BD779DRAFT_106912 [Infundibulicybe gibba]